jgi:hypothetical protein
MTEAERKRWAQIHEADKGLPAGWQAVWVEPRPGHPESDGGIRYLKGDKLVKDRPIAEPSAEDAMQMYLSGGTPG